MGATLLSVDFDYFFPVYRNHPKLWQLYDWTNSESRLQAVELMIWNSRASGFLLNDLPLPDVLPFDAFWDRFDLSEVMTMMISDSHKYIGNDLAYYRGGKILNFDAHHDAGYGKQDVINATANPTRVTCSNWAMIANDVLGIDVHTFYPEWHRDRKTTRDGSPKCKKVQRMID